MTVIRCMHTVPLDTPRAIRNSTHSHIPCSTHHTGLVQMWNLSCLTYLKMVFVH